MPENPPKPNPDYRENPNRCVRIFGEFNDAMAESALIEIAKLRSESSEPITVYINSNGGFVRSLGVIHGALSTRDQSGNKVRIITVCSGDASSAAANLLAFGDYAIAYQHSLIYFHGVRASDLLVTAEDAASIAKHFSGIDRETANNLAERIFGRLFHRYLILRNQVRKSVKKSRKKKKPRSELDCFVECVKSRVGVKAANIVDKSAKRVYATHGLVANVFPKASRMRSLSALKQDAKILRCLIDHEVNQYQSTDWRFDENGIARLASDYLMMRDYFFGSHVAIINKSVKTYGQVFLSDAEFKRYEKKLSKGDKSAEEIIDKRARPKAEPFFYFAHSLCRYLMEGENKLSPKDAYWLGVVDEVVGTSYHGTRMVMERSIEESLPSGPTNCPASSPAPTSSAPPTLQSPAVVSI